MNEVSSMPRNGGSQDDTDASLRFFKALQAVTNKIHATDNIDEIILDVSHDICTLFGCDRLTIYAVSPSKTSIETRVKTGLNTYKDFTLPISDKSIAGYVALTRKLINIGNVYDESELQSYAPGLQFVRKVDQRTGYSTKQMLTAPLLNAETHELLGVLQLINNLSQKPFSTMIENGARELCETLAIAFAQRAKPPVVIRTKYDPLVAEAILSTPELVLAGRSARRKGIDLEDVLINEFQVQRTAVGDALATFFGVPYQPFDKAWSRPTELLKNFDRDYVESNRWLPLQKVGSSMIVLTTDPKRVKSSHIVSNLFPKAKLSFRVTTNGEFRQAIDHFFGTVDGPEARGNGTENLGLDQIAAAENALVNRVNTVIIDAFHQGAADIQIALRPNKEKTISCFRKDGTLESIKGQTVIEFQISFPELDDE